MKVRHRGREAAFQFLYQQDIHQQGAKIPTPLSPAALAHTLNLHFEHFQIPPKTREFAAHLITGTLTHLTELDRTLEETAAHWKLPRMGLVDRNLLRLALYELTHCPEIPTSVTLDEAIELSKQFGTKDSSGFVNGILDAIAKKVRPSDPGRSQD